MVAVMSERPSSFMRPLFEGVIQDGLLVPFPDIAPGQREEMRVTLPSGARRLVLRSPPEIKAKVDVLIEGQRAGQLHLLPYMA